MDDLKIFRRKTGWGLKFYKVKKSRVEKGKWVDWLPIKFYEKLVVGRDKEKMFDKTFFCCNPLNQWFSTFSISDDTLTFNTKRSLFAISNQQSQLENERFSLIIYSSCIKHTHTHTLLKISILDWKRFK